jgi:hypothetical protein
MFSNRFISRVADIRRYATLLKHASEPAVDRSNTPLFSPPEPRFEFPSPASDLDVYINFLGWISFYTE